MLIPKEFDEIRPWEPEDLPQVYDRLLGNEQFKKVVAYVLPGVPFGAVAEKMRACKSTMQFQLAFVYEFIKKLMEKASTGFDLDATAIDRHGNYTFVSNHRDIVMDSGLLDELLVDAHFDTTCEIAIGDNLLAVPWVKDFCRLNKAFIVERGLPPRQMLQASKRLSDYMHFAITQKHENVWIAQREGRAKDSNDRTQEGVLKMMAMGGEGTVAQRLAALHIVPTTISYEYDPCDFLKAKEFQQKRDTPGWKKGPTDDLVSMETGIMGYKGHVHYHCSACLDEWLLALEPDMPKGAFFKEVAERIDHDIHANYRLYPNNFVALDELEGSSDNNGHYTTADKRRFDEYIAAQLARIELPNKDEAYLRERMLTMYANPVRNFRAATAPDKA